MQCLENPVQTAYGIVNFLPRDAKRWRNRNNTACTAEHAVWLDTGPEPIAGSTRMKAGTAQKVALNLFSTLLMIRLGRVYKGLMVDVHTTNEKLRDRAVRMVQEITGVDDAAAGDAVSRSNGHVKLAVLVAKGLSPDAAKTLLLDCSEDLGTALTRL